jgi:four helix bundle protein
MKKEINDFEDLAVWQKSHRLVLEIYKITNDFPKFEEFGLTNQLRRSAASIPTNIAEGLGANSKVNFRRMLFIARGSLVETRYHLILARDLGYISISTYKSLKVAYNEVGKMLNALINSLGKKNSE